MKLKLLLCVLSGGTLLAGNVAELPLKEVTLYSSGVGAFVHQGKIEGKTSVRFRMTNTQLNDLLKSLYVTAEKEGVSIHSVNYPTKLPAGTLLEGFRINIDRIHSLADLLRQLPGEEFQMQLSGGLAPVKGKLIAVETKKITRQTTSGSRVEQLDYAVMLTDKGFQRLPVAELNSIVPTDKTLLVEMTKILAVLGEQRNKSLRVMDVQLSAKNPSEVRMAYVIEAPVWKSSYRLELPDKKGKANLQGWALVENPTNAEWKDVTLSLISGRPESFIQDLYTSLYLERPMVQREEIVSAGPMRHGIASANAAPMLGKSRKAKMSAGVCRLEADSMSVANAPEFQRVGGSMTISKEAMGELCCYRIAKPVTLGSRQSAMLELISTPVSAEKISFYSLCTNEKHPRNAVILKNQTNLLLPQGPVTIFEGKNYGGDASLSDLPSGQEQILSYGTDLEVSVLPGDSGYTMGMITDLTIDRGMLKYSLKRTVTNSCTFENKSKKEKVILFEIPREKNGKIVSSLKPTSMTGDSYRFTLDLKAGKKLDVKIQQEIPLKQSFAVSANSDFTGYLFASKNAALSPESKALAEKLLAFSRKIKDLQLELKDTEEKIRDLAAKQDRTRANINANIGSDLRARLNKRLAETDEALDKQYQKKDSLKSAIRKLREEFGAFLSGTAK